MSARVLVVDDEIRYRELYMQVLASAGFETEATNLRTLMRLLTKPPQRANRISRPLERWR